MQGFCECGCGRKTTIHVRNHKQRGWIKGQASRFIPGHGKRGNGKFWERSNKTKSCWIWNGANNGNGYGIVTFKGKKVFAHRMAWIKTFGEIPNEKLVLHKCDNRSCVNPEHLFLGNHSDNLIDCVKKGRWPTRFNPSQIIEMRNLHRAGMSQHAIARQFNTSQAQIWRIVHKTIWTFI